MKSSIGDSSAWGWLDLADGLGTFGGSIGAIIGVFILIALFTIGIALLLPAVVLFLELLLVIPLVIAGLLLRILFRRPWLIDAVGFAPDGDDHIVWAVVGYRRSSEAVAEIADQLRRGISIPVVPDGTLLIPKPS
ncbi:MAG: hypothetical protein QOG54_2773 [Actinomycetota bacterium]|nr:hypothetical protein [Actinomycetota bacterium]